MTDNFNNPGPDDDPFPDEYKDPLSKLLGDCEANIENTLVPPVQEDPLDFTGMESVMNANREQIDAGGGIKTKDPPPPKGDTIEPMQCIPPGRKNGPSIKDSPYSFGRATKRGSKFYHSPKHKSPKNSLMPDRPGPETWCPKYGRVVNMLSFCIDSGCPEFENIPYTYCKLKK